MSVIVYGFIFILLINNITNDKYYDNMLYFDTQKLLFIPAVNIMTLIFYFYLLIYNIVKKINGLYRKK